MTLVSFRDRPERTLLVVEAAAPVPWTKPIDLPYMAVAQIAAARRRFQGRIRTIRHGGVDGCNVVFADASVRLIPKAKLEGPGLRALITGNGRESTDGFEFLTDVDSS